MIDHIQSFDNVDDMFKAIHDGVEQAKKNILPRQSQITYGDYWMRVWGDILIFGYIHTPEELDAEERRLGASEEEIAWEHETMRNSYENGFRFGTAYSVIEQRGELGDTHVSTMVPITRQEFEDAKSLNWNPEDIVPRAWFWHAVERLASDDE